MPGVFVGTGAPGEASRLDADFVLLDCPPIFDRGADAFIGRANGVILTTLPDPLAIRTIPGATSVLKDVLALHDDLSFLGIAVSIYKDDDPLQREMLETLRARLGELCLEPPIPWQRELADWSLERLDAYIAANNVPVNALHARGFPSIGCQPCTRAIAPEEDIRAGRWWWENPETKECGLHSPARHAARQSA